MNYGNTDESLGSEAREANPDDYIDAEVVETEVEPTDDVNVEDVPFEIPDGYRLMSDEEATELAKTLIEDYREKWEIQEVCDDLVLAGQTSDLLRNEFLYEFKQGGRIVRGLTAPMIKHLATARGISEVTEERVYNSDDDKSEFDVVVEMVNPFDPNHKLKRSGFAEEPKTKSGKYNKFHKQTAHTKAFRNAALGLLPQDLIITTIHKLAKLVPTDFQPRSIPKESNTVKAMKCCFAVYGKYEKDILETHGVSREAFGDAIREYYEVGSRKDLTAAQWDELRKSLETEGYGDVVKRIIKIVKEGIPF